MIINGSFGVLISRIIISDKIEKVSTLTCQGLFLSNLGNYQTREMHTGNKVVGVEPVTKFCPLLGKVS